MSSTHPKILLIGKNGQVGHALLPMLDRAGNVVALDRSGLDLSNADHTRQCVRTVRPDYIINAAAYTAVDKAETEPALAHVINAKAPAVLAQEAAQLNCLLIHYSTDYVFDGLKASPYEEDDPTCPINTYGVTKAAGEQAIRETGCRHLIFRTSWVFSDRGNNFLLTMLKLARERNQLRIVNDQIGTPTSSESIARATVHVLNQFVDAHISDEPLGTYHMVAGGETSWFGFAEQIFKRTANCLPSIPQVLAISSAEYPLPARRPLNSRLASEKFVSTFLFRLASWQDGLDAVLNSLNVKSFQKKMHDKEVRAGKP